MVDSCPTWSLAPIDHRACHTRPRPCAKCKATSLKRHVIPAVTHEDGTGRVQTVTEASNPLYYRLLMALRRRTGVPVALNTSFNVRGEPIVGTPEDAFRCFMGTEMDLLAVGCDSAPGLKEGDCTRSVRTS